MRFGAGYLSIWLWIVPVTIFLLAIAERARRRTLEKFARPEMLPALSENFDPRKRRLRGILIILCLLFSIISLMRPQWGFSWREVKRQGLDILLALDTSNSMLAEDVLPNRLSRAKLAIRDLVKKLNGDRIGLVVFSGTAFLQCPLTIDYDGFILSLEDVDVDSIPVGGTSLSKAIYKSMDSFEGGKKQHKILIMITDGEDLEGGLNAAIEKARHDKLMIFSVGIGDEDGELIPIMDRNGKKAFLKDGEGNIVKTKLKEGPLQEMALKTGGIYVHATGAEFGLDLIYEERLADLEKQDFKSKMEKIYHERFQIPLLIAIVLLLLEAIVGERRKERLTG